MHMHVSVYLEEELPCQFPVFQTTHFGALVRLLFHVSRITNFLDLDFNFMFNSAFNFEYPFNCGGYYDGALSARARGFAFCVYFH